MTTSFPEHDDAGCSPAEPHPPAAALAGAAVKTYRADPDAVRTLDRADQLSQLSGRSHTQTDGGVS